MSYREKLTKYNSKLKTLKKMFALSGGLLAWAYAIAFLQLCQSLFAIPPPPPAPPLPTPAPPSPALTRVFLNGEHVPGYSGHTYGFQIPAITRTPKGALLAFVQGYVRPPQFFAQMMTGVPPRVGDGDDNWMDIVVKRSSDNGRNWGELVVVCRNTTKVRGKAHACQQPTPISDGQSGKVWLLTSLDNWHQQAYSSTDDGISWSAAPTNLDASLRKPGFGLVFNGLPGGIQLESPSKFAGRLIACSSAYWTGGALNPDGSIAQAGDGDSRFSFSIISDDGGTSWRIGSGGPQRRSRPYGILRPYGIRVTSIFRGLVSSHEFSIKGK